MLLAILLEVGGEKMKRKNTYVGLVLLLAVLMLGIGYAAITNIDLKIGGSAKAVVSDENFKVAFTDKSASDENIVTAGITDDHNATIKVESLTAKGDSVTATYTITNQSEDLSASITKPTVTNDNEEYFSVTTDWDAAKEVAAKGTTTVTVTVELIKTPIDADETANINISFVASPVQP